jgi:ferritin-like metal-binding protein YciE
MAGTGTIDEQLTKYLSEAHSLEEQALAQLRSAPDAAGDEQLAGVFRQHLEETEEHERLVRDLLERRGESPSRVKDAVMKMGGKGFLAFARAQPDTPGKLTAHAFSYEHLEVAAYELLARVAEQADDEETAQVARRIRAEEQEMADRLAGGFDRAVEASLRAVGRDDLDEQLDKYLADAHAIEAQAIQLLQKGPDLAGDAEIARIYVEHLDQTRRHQRLIADRLETRNADPSMLKDLAMRTGAVNWALFFQAHPDTPGKLVAFAYAFEHLEIAGYEQLAEVAERAGDTETVQLAEQIGEEERQAAKAIAELWSVAAHASMREVRS